MFFWLHCGGYSILLSLSGKKKFFMTKRYFGKAFFIAFLMAFGTLWVSAQENYPVSTSNKIVKEPDVMPMFTGGSGEMNRFISRTLQYPADARERNAQGLVVYTFVVEKDGSLSNFDIIHRADSSLNREALRILQAMPLWRPARHKGEIVRAESYVPMYFRLSSGARTASAARQAQPVAKQDKEIENEMIFSIVDKMPEYEYGPNALNGFIEKQLRYPVDARQEGIEGRILCSFIVRKDGKISNVEVVQGLHPSLDREAVRVLSLMSPWIPGQNNSENVNVKCLLPIDFKIDEQAIPASR